MAIHIPALAVLGALRLGKKVFDTWRESRASSPPPSGGTVYSGKGNSGLKWYAVPPGLVAEFLRSKGGACPAEAVLEIVSKPEYDAALRRQVRAEYRDMATSYPGLALFAICD